MRNVLLCTVGRSLLDNLSKTIEVDKLNQAERKAYDAAREAYGNKQWVHVAKALLEIDPTRRICGAEINSVEELLRRRRVALQNLVLLVSDTPIGRYAGAILKSYFERRRDAGFKSVDVEVIEDLRDDDPKVFKTHGLRNLVRSIGVQVARFGGSERILINATGGYKAQIAVAVIMGQALDIPVFYKHEFFQEIIDFPPLPISFDYDLLGRNAALLTDFERGAALHSSEIGEIDEKLRALLVEVEVDGETMYELSPVGQIFLSSFRVRNPKPVNLVPATHREEPSFSPHHYPKGFPEFVRKVWTENDWIRTAKATDYSGQRAIKGIGFEVVEVVEGGERTYRLIGTYQDKDKFGARFLLELTDESHQALVWAADHLNRRYRNS